MRLVGRRLPDLLIGILIVVLALGLGSLLLTQRNRAAITPSALTPPPASTAEIPAAPGTGVTNTQAVTPPDAGQVGAGQTGTTSAVPSTPADTAPAASPTADPAQAVQTPITNQPATNQPVTAPAASTPASGDQTAAAAQPESPTTPPSTATPAQPGQTQPSTGPVATSPLAPPVTPQPDTSQPPVTTTPAPTAQPTTVQPTTVQPTTVQPTTGQPTTPQLPTAPPAAAATTPPRSGGAVATSETRTPLRRDYRVSLGTFGSVAEAQASTAAVSALGYTVYPIDLGSQVVAQVGPFANASDANAALSDILRAYGGALLYAPRSSVGSGSDQPAASGGSDSARSNAGVAAPSPSAAPAVSSATNSPAPAQAAPSQPAQAAAPSGPVYLQVGAFDRQESAARLVGLLDDLGYNPSVQAPEGKKVTVLIGPFSGEAVLRAESKLNDNGFDHFRVR